MIEFTKGDVIQADAEALVNSVNCVGVMGRGVALQFKTAYPANFKEYAAACKRDEVQPGRMFTFETGKLRPRWIINFPTKRHWRGKSRIEDIEAGLAALVEEIKARDIKSIALPPLGSGLGGLAWREVRPLIERALAEVPDVQAIVHEPGGPMQDLRPNRSKEPPRMTPGRAALIGLMRQYLAGMMETSISLLEIHKLMYFLQATGEPLKLQFQKGPYGPYARNLRHVLHAIDGHLITGYRAAGDAPDEQVSLVPGAVEDAEEFLNTHDETRDRFAQVAQLVDGFETPFGLELLATAHWVASEDSASTEDDVRDRFYAWGPRKRQFTDDQVKLAMRRLKSGGWLN